MAEMNRRMFLGGVVASALPVPEPVKELVTEQVTGIVPVAYSDPLPERPERLEVSEHDLYQIFCKSEHVRASDIHINLTLGFDKPNV